MPLYLFISCITPSSSILNTTHKLPILFGFTLYVRTSVWPIYTFTLALDFANELELG